MYSVRLSSAGARAFREADSTLAKKIARCFEHLSRDPRDHPNIRPLTGPLAGSYRFRIGDHRVVYQIREESKTVVVTSIEHRRDVYR